MNHEVLIQFALVAALLLWIPWLLHQQGLSAYRKPLYIAALCGAMSLFFESGHPFGILLAGIWCLGCISIGFLTFRQTFFWGHDHFGHFLNGLASIFLVGGSVWFMAARLETSFLGFGGPWKTLTAIHFHYSGYLLTSIFALHWSVIKAKSSSKYARVFQAAALLYILSFLSCKSLS